VNRCATIVEIIDAAITATGVPLEALLSPLRGTRVVRTRELIAVLARRNSAYSASEVAHHLGVSHSTILYARARLEARLADRDPEAVHLVGTAQTALNALTAPKRAPAA